MYVKRTTETIVTLKKENLSVQGFSFCPSPGNQTVETYKIPKAKIAVKINFWDLCTSSLQISGTGKAKSSKSVMIWGIAQVHHNV